VGTTESAEYAPDGAPAGMAMEATRQWLPGQRPAWTVRPHAALKRTIDVLLSAIILVALVPVIAIVALAVRIESPGPLFYRAERVGRGGRTFRMLKFRKMQPDSGGLRLTTRDDARFTRVGGFLARSKLDELPQLLNVLRGDMSLIGPRPEDAGFVIRRQADYEVILRVRPGITGLAQIAFAEESRILSDEDPLGHYLHGIFPQKCTLDRLYVRTAGIWTDMRILFWTLITVVFKRPVAVHRSTGRMHPRRRPG
jgi:lipopolysaccharide/colanic/teichoic acid biosynthesis glycosyltransferase